MAGQHESSIGFGGRQMTGGAGNPVIAAGMLGTCCFCHSRKTRRPVKRKKWSTHLSISVKFLNLIAAS
jgi:hypothetical protein